MNARTFFSLIGLFAGTTCFGQLSDTGQTTRYTQTFGEDADFKGSQPTFKDNGDGTVTDLVTGLMWQKTDGGEMTHEKAREHAQSLTLAGHDDWRLPGSMELFSLMNHAMHGPAMDTTIFTATEARYWWTDSPRADDSSKIWLVNTGGGIGAHAKAETVSAGGERPVHVRCVRGTSKLGDGPSLTDHGNGTLTDSRTGLTWQKIGPAEGMTWEEALKHCDSLWLAGQNGWRLPNIKELRSLSDDRLTQPSLDRKLFPHAESTAYWSSTTQSNRAERAWYVDFTTGLVTYADKTERLLVLAVRGGAAEPASREKPAPDPRMMTGSGEAKGKGKKGKPKK
jgi:hypothetical protein